MNFSSSASIFSYFEIVQQVIVRWNDADCQSVQPVWASEVISYWSIILSVVYTYIIVRMLWSNPGSSFYHCALMLYLGDISILLIGIKDSILRSCIIDSSLDFSQHLAFLAMTTWGLQLTVTTNLTMAIMRFAAVFWDERTSEEVAKIGLRLSFLYALVHVLLVHFGFTVTMVVHRDRVFSISQFPLDQIRKDGPFHIVSVTLVIYVMTLAGTRRFSNYSSNRKAFKREMLFLAQSLLIFVKQILYLIVMFDLLRRWRLLGGDENDNAVFVAGPLTSGLTPFLYLLFSKQVRKAVFHFRPWAKTKIQAIPLQTVMSARSTVNPI